MKASEFCYWLQGYLEVRSVGTGTQAGGPIERDQVKMIEQHLAMVFKHDLDPQQGSLEHQAELQAIHDSGRPQFGGTGPNGEVYRC